jgi:hypothetical protein
MGRIQMHKDYIVAHDLKNKPFLGLFFIFCVVVLAVDLSLS